MTGHEIWIGGAGIIGLWQALVLAGRGHRVRVFERTGTPFAGAASRYAGAMLAPDCEAEAAPRIVRDLGRASLAPWRAVYPGLVTRGSLVVAQARDRPDLQRFARLTEAHVALDAKGVATLEPDLGARFPAALHYPDEAHMPADDALRTLLAVAEARGVVIAWGTPLPERVPGEVTVVDCRGLAARADITDLRGVRGERLLVRARDVTLTRPVRLLHPRHPIYVVPWADGRYVIGATVIESEDAGPATVRSALELLGAAYALHPGFGEAEIVEVGAGVRPALPDNVPRALIRDGGRCILVNGAYRHGFLLAPILAEAVADVVGGGDARHPLVVS